MKEIKMNQDQLRIKYWSGLSKVIPLIIYTFCMVYITKYVNMQIKLNYLYVVSILGSLLAIMSIFLSIKGNSLSFIDKNIRVINCIDYTIETIITLLLLIDPLLYLISSGLYKGTIGKTTSIGWRNLWNKIFTEELKTQFEGFREIMAYIAAIIGGGIGFFIGDNISITVVIYIAAIGNIIHAIISQYTIHLCIKYKEKYNK